MHQIDLLIKNLEDEAEKFSKLIGSPFSFGKASLEITTRTGESLVLELEDLRKLKRSLMS